MKKAKTILIAGVWIAVLPYLGFPYLIKNLLISLSALFIAYIGFILYKHHSINEDDNEYENFSENKDFIEEEPLEISIESREEEHEEN